MKNEYLEILRRHMPDVDETELVLAVFKCAIADAKVYLIKGREVFAKFNAKAAYDWVVIKNKTFSYWCDLAGLDEEFVRSILLKELTI